MFKKVSVFMIIFSLSILNNISTAKNLYVNGTTGNDATTYTDNSSGSPWATIGRAVWGNSIRPANVDNGNPPTSNEAAQAGDTVFVSAGTYNVTQGSSEQSRQFVIYGTMNEGTLGNPIVIKADGIVQLNSNVPFAQPVIGAHRRNYIEWNGFTLYTDSLLQVNDEFRPSVLWDCVGSSIKNCVYYGNYNNDGPGRNTPFIYIHNMFDAYVGNCYFTGSRGNSSHNNTALTLYNTNGCIIEYCTFLDNDGGVYAKAPLGSDDTQNTQTDITIRYCWFEGNDKDIHFLTNRWGGSIEPESPPGKIYQNVFLNSTTNSIELDGGGADGWRDMDSLHIVNNTFYNCQIAIEHGYDDQYDDLLGYNNIVVSTTYPFLDPSVDSDYSEYNSDYNCYYDNGPTFFWGGNTQYSYAEWQSVFSQDANSITANPLFEDASSNNFILQAASPCSIGIDVLDLDNDGDYANNINMGAYITGNEIIGVGGSYVPIPIVPIPTGIRIEPVDN